MFVDKEEHVYRTVLGRNGFHLGAQKGILHKLSSLLDDDDTNATINSKGKNGDTPLHLACTEGHSEVVRWLIMKKADLNAVNRDGETPLHKATAFGNLLIVQLLKNNGANCKAVDINGNTPLHRAAAWGHIEIVKELINDNKCLGNIQNKDGNTALHVASYFGSYEIIKYLLHQGVDHTLLNNNSEHFIDCIQNEVLQTFYEKLYQNFLNGDMASPEVTEDIRQNELIRKLNMEVEEVVASEVRARLVLEQELQLSQKEVRVNYLSSINYNSSNNNVEQKPKRRKHQSDYDNVINISEISTAPMNHLLRKMDVGDYNTLTSTPRLQLQVYNESLKDNKISRISQNLAPTSIIKSDFDKNYCGLSAKFIFMNSAEMTKDTSKSMLPLGLIRRDNFDLVNVNIQRSQSVLKPQLLLSIDTKSDFRQLLPRKDSLRKLDSLDMHDVDCLSKYNHNKDNFIITPSRSLRLEAIQLQLDAIQIYTDEHNFDPHINRRHGEKSHSNSMDELGDKSLPQKLNHFSSSLNSEGEENKDGCISNTTSAIFDETSNQEKVFTGRDEYEVDSGFEIPHRISTPAFRKVSPARSSLDGSDIVSFHRDYSDRPIPKKYKPVMSRRNTASRVMTELASPPSPERKPLGIIRTPPRTTASPMSKVRPSTVPSHIVPHRKIEVKKVPIYPTPKKGSLLNKNISLSVPSHIVPRQYILPNQKYRTYDVKSNVARDRPLTSSVKRNNTPRSVISRYAPKAHKSTFTLPKYEKLSFNKVKSRLHSPTNSSRSYQSSTTVKNQTPRSNKIQMKFRTRSEPSFSMTRSSNSQSRISSPAKSMYSRNKRPDARSPKAPFVLPKFEKLDFSNVKSKLLIHTSASKSRPVYREKKNVSNKLPTVNDSPIRVLNDDFSSSDGLTSAENSPMTLKIKFSPDTRRSFIPRWSRSPSILANRHYFVSRHSYPPHSGPLFVLPAVEKVSFDNILAHLNSQSASKSKVRVVDSEYISKARHNAHTEALQRPNNTPSLSNTPSPRSRSSSISNSNPPLQSRSAPASIIKEDTCSIVPSRHSLSPNMFSKLNTNNDNSRSPCNDTPTSRKLTIDSDSKLYSPTAASIAHQWKNDIVEKNCIPKFYPGSKLNPTYTGEIAKVTTPFQSRDAELPSQCSNDELKGVRKRFEFEPKSNGTKSLNPDFIDLSDYRCQISALKDRRHTLDAASLSRYDSLQVEYYDDNLFDADDNQSTSSYNTSQPSCSKRKISNSSGSDTDGNNVEWWNSAF